MVLGFLLYEAVDMAYHATKLTFNSASFLYNWYYDISIHNLDNKVQHEERVKQLETMLDISGNNIIHTHHCDSI